MTDKHTPTIAVPEGWKLVPVEPTPEQYVRIVGGGITCEQAKAFYRAMVDLAPPAPAAAAPSLLEALEKTLAAYIGASKDFMRVDSKKAEHELLGFMDDDAIVVQARAAISSARGEG